MTASAPRITRVHLRQGTRFRVVENGHLSEPRMLERTIDVTVAVVALSEDEYSVFVLDDGTDILVQARDEVRGPAK